MKPLFSVVIPIFNEEENLPELIRRVIAVCRDFCKKKELEEKDRGKPSFELIVVDDGSSDNSAAILRRSVGEISEMTALFFAENCGQHTAVRAGMKWSCGDIVITLDGDLQNPPEEIPNLLRAIEGVDVVGTIRRCRQDSFFRRTASFCVNSIIGIIIKRSTGIMMHDYGCMLRAYRRRVVDALLQCGNRSGFIPVLANRFAEKTREIEVRHNERKHGKSKYSLWRLFVLQWKLLLSLPEFPRRGVITVAGGAGLVLGLTAGHRHRHRLDEACP